MFTTLPPLHSEIPSDNAQTSVKTNNYFRPLVILMPLLLIIGMTYLFQEIRVYYPSRPPSPTAWIVDHPSYHHRRQSSPMSLAQLSNSHSASSLPSSSPISPSSTLPVSTSTPPSVSDQAVPTVPNSAPILPTPFPQAFDSGLAQNFSTTSCAAFFTNMTSVPAFRTCRPFSLLLGTSTAFINAQTNLTLLNSIIWGTCNTPTSYEQCKSNMAWFAGALQTSCAQELKERNEVVVNALIGLQTFEILRTAGCLSDPTSQTYCYLTAALTSNPFDTFLYSLPLGTKIPKSSTPTCSACSKSIMGWYADGIKSGATGLDQLKSTYPEALKICRNGCGTDFSLIGVGLDLGTSSDSRELVGCMRVWKVLMVLFCWAVMFLFV